MGRAAGRGALCLLPVHPNLIDYPGQQLPRGQAKTSSPGLVGASLSENRRNEIKEGTEATVTKVRTSRYR